MLSYQGAYHGDHSARPDAVSHAHLALVVRVLSPLQEMLLSHVVSTIIDHEHAAVHPDGVTAVEVRVQVGTVTHALMVTATKVPVLIEDNLRRQKADAMVHMIPRSSGGIPFFGPSGKDSTSIIVYPC